MRKKLLSLALALVLALSLIPSAFAAETGVSKFTDVPADAWYLDELEYAVANGYISGVGDNRFAPDGNITRGQFVTILGRMLNVSTSSGATKFVDVAESSYYAPYVAWAAANGIVKGTSSTTYAPDSNITFEQMGVILANYISKSGVVLSGYTASPAYKDAASISAYAVSSMEQMRQYGLISPDEAGNVNPQKAVSRAYGTVSLVRLAKAMGLGEAPATAPTESVAPAGDVFSRFITGNPQLITSFKYNDEAAWDNIIRYMLKYGLSELELTIEYDDAYFNNYNLGYVDVSYLNAADKYDCFGCFYDLQQPVGRDMIQRRTFTVTRSTNNIVVDALLRAVEVHDSMWSTGKITSSMTQKEKARVYYDWLLGHCEYDWDSLKVDDSDFDGIGGFAWDFVSAADANHEAYSALVEGKAVCDGYTNAYNLLLMLEGIDCELIGSMLGGHAWTAATLDGVLYHIDPTWGDTTGSADKYFCMTPDAAWARFGGYEKELEFRNSVWSGFGW